MFNLTAYMDETGHPNDPNSKFIGMGGLIATKDSWLTFERDWKNILNKFGLPYFHMVDFAHSTGIFESFKGKESKRRTLLQEIMQAIRKAYALPFGSIFSLELIRSYPKYLQVEARSPYFLAFIGCSSAIADLMVPMRPYGENITTVFAEHTEFQNKAKKIHEVIKVVHPAGDLLDSPAFKSMKSCGPLQAADVVVYELYKEADRKYFRPNEKMRWGFSELQEIVKLSARGIDPLIIKRNETVIKNHMNDAKRRVIEAITLKQN